MAMQTNNSGSELQQLQRLDDDDDGEEESRADGRKRRRTDIREWLAAVYTRSVNAGERLLEEGRVAEAATAFANATLLTDAATAFAAAVGRVYPSYFYRLYERRMTAMGYGHLFTAAAAADKTPIVAEHPRHGSPVIKPQRTVARSSSDVDHEDDDRDDG